MHDAGLLDPLPRKHREVPADAPPSVPPVWGGFLLLVGLKDHVPEWKGTPAAYSWRFIVSWCGVTIEQARYAMPWLLKHKFIEGIKLDKKVYGRAMEVFQPVSESDTIISLDDLQGVMTAPNLMEECDADNEDRESEAISVVSGSVGLAGEDGTGDERGVLPERHSGAPGDSGLRRPAPDPHAPVRVRQVRKPIRSQVREEVPSRVPQPDIEAASKAEVRAFWATRVPSRVDSRTGDDDSRG